MTATSPPPEGGRELGDANPAKPKRTVDLGIATIVAAVIGAVALVGGGVLGRMVASNNKPQPAPTVTATATITASPAPPHVTGLHFALHSPARIPWCNTLSGSGTIPRGDSLVIFDTAVSSPLYYHLDGFATQTSKNIWSLTPVYIGKKHETGLKDDIAGVLVTDQAARFIRSIVAAPPKSSFWVARDDLPPGLEYLRLKTTRTKDAAQCAP